MRAMQIQRLEGSRSPGVLCIFYRAAVDSMDGSAGAWGPCGSIAAMECVEMGGFEAAWEGC